MIEPTSEEIADTIIEHAKVYNLRLGDAVPIASLLHKMATKLGIPSLSLGDHARASR